MSKNLLSLVSGSLRYRLLALVLFPLLLVLPGVIALAYLWSNEVGYRQLLMKANTDLAVAHETFTATREQYLVRLSLVASDYRFRRDLLPLSQAASSSPDIQTLEARLEKATGFDYVRLVDPKQCVPYQALCQYPNSPLLAQSIQMGATSGVEIFSAAQLRQLSPELAHRAQLVLIPTEHSDRSSNALETRGMMLHFVYPIIDDARNTVALLAAGLLMNDNLAFVDGISNTVYGPGSLPENGIGTVTLFLDDIRISTNVPHPSTPKQRALGTRVSNQVREQVLEQGQRWLDRAFVVNDWYISAYEPVLDVNGQYVGMLYAGFLEAPFLASFYYWLELLVWLFAMVLILCIGIAIKGARSIAKPLEVMSSVMDRIRDGERQRIPTLATTHEVQQLADHFNAMQEKLEAQHDAIQAAAEDLEEKVSHRTEALQKRTQELKQHINLLNDTREQLIEKGKLAALGELTAGVAHEINNPTAVILGYMDLLMDELGDQATPEIRHDADLIIAQVDRIRTIINDLLKLARSDSQALVLQAIDVNQVIRNTHTLVNHELKRRNITLTLDLKATTQIQADPAQLQQVLINLIMNGANAIVEHGEIIIRSRNSHDGKVRLNIRDSGSGIAKQHLTRIFDPFFSRSQEGTGLGLSISHRLLMQADADITVRSRLGKGTVFFIWLKGK